MPKSLCRRFKNTLNVFVLEAAAANFAGVVAIEFLVSFQFCMVRRVKRLCDDLSFPEQSAFSDILMLEYKITRMDKFVVTCKNWCFVNLWAT